MSFNNIWFLFLLFPLVALFIMEIYISKKDPIFPNAVKKIRNQKSKKNIYSQYSFFLNKFSDVKKYNLDIESFLIEFNSKLTNE